MTRVAVAMLLLPAALAFCPSPPMSIRAHGTSRFPGAKLPAGGVGMRFGEFKRKAKQESEDDEDTPLLGGIIGPKKPEVIVAPEAVKEEVKVETEEEKNARNLADLLQKCEACRQGRDGTGEVSDSAWEELVETVALSNPTDDPATSPLMGGTWELAWTNEKEVRLLMNQGLFGEECVRVFQEIDTAKKTLGNNMIFTTDSSFKVQSNFRPGQGGPGGINNVRPRSDIFSFEFQSAKIRVRGFEVTLPPVGKGWGQQMYLDEKVRIQRDSRDDLSIYVRAES
mmetsp:Transcript_16635/g.32806  ORF Transcript_16635/g.32806 Transcript_16635/m.32806 type:complete len:282 (+) Transcript_16635:47-892(+)|eukprot:CAMPEP_0173381054 /NCGR_PEP_ID=MMETSP1356-20130122/3556_1 /TAXON_ID=77927 ORGANISM="Hemiselmis virescens, Strain PCC157" /NCGR_SAMPLE_ID=MMETSP1356 /ASSEMBLY_ACC=CAM_ASM_000847 /LENGTH=281 /DNA_ID=CAMNT_0014334795 /DNA_START=44 /DNA_END=889 /DNA_ORIENTATION=+